MATSVKDVIEKQVATYLDEHKFTNQNVRSIFQWCDATGRKYTVVRNALNRLTAEGKCTRRMRWGCYHYTFTRPVAA